MPATRSKPHHSAPHHTPYSVKISSDPQYESKIYLVEAMNTLIIQELQGTIWLDVDAMQLIKQLFSNQSPNFNAENGIAHFPIVWNGKCPSADQLTKVKLQSLKLLPGSTKYLLQLMLIPKSMINESAHHCYGTVVLVSNHSL